MNTLKSESLTLRKIAPSDLPFLYQVFASTRMGEMKLTGWPEEQIDWFLQMQFNLQHSQWQQNFPSAEFNLILLENQPIGRLYIDRRQTVLHIIDIAILPAFQGRGIGTFFLQRMKEEAKQNKLNLSLHVEKNNPARSLYERMGFMLVEEGDVYDFLEIKNS